MAKNRVEVSVTEEVKNVTDAMSRVTRAIFAGTPGRAKSIKGKRKSAQFTFKMREPSVKTNIERVARRKIMQQVFQKRGPEIEAQIKKAIMSVIMGLVGQRRAGIKVFGRSLGTAKPARQIEQEPFAKFVTSKRGAGEVGLPDPEESLRTLKLALMDSIAINVTVRSSGPQIKFTFDQRKLLKLTPHPAQFEGGVVAPFFSWLSLVTGPDFASRGTPGYSLVSVREMKQAMRSQNQELSRQRSRRGLRSVRSLEGLMSLPRTSSNAGEFAALMLSNRRRAGRRSVAEFAGGSNQQYVPSRRFEGFWDAWWLRTKRELGVWSRRIMIAAVRSVITR